MRRAKYTRRPWKGFGKTRSRLTRADATIRGHEVQIGRREIHIIGFAPFLHDDVCLDFHTSWFVSKRISDLRTSQSVVFQHGCIYKFWTTRYLQSINFHTLPMTPAASPSHRVTRASTRASMSTSPPSIIGPRHRQQLRAQSKPNSPNPTRYAIVRPASAGGCSQDGDSSEDEDEDSPASELLKLKQRLATLIAVSWLIHNLLVHLFMSLSPGKRYASHSSVTV